MAKYEFEPLHHRALGGRVAGLPFTLNVERCDGQPEALNLDIPRKTRLRGEMTL